MSCSYKENKVLFVLINSIIFLGVIILFILAEYGIIPRFRAGFYCDDPQLMYPFTGDTVTSTTAICIVIIIPPLLMFVSETMIYFCDYDAFERREFCKFMKIAFFWCRDFFIILGFTNVLMYVFKMTCGEPRPDFLDTCKPDVCKTLIENKFHQQYECTNTDLSSGIIENSSKSFLSGHAANSVYASAFMFWYIQKRVNAYSPKLVALTLQILSIIFGIVCSITRITDHRHHWWDVACGAILGALTAIFAVRLCCNNFSVHTFSSSRVFFSNQKNNERNQDVIEIK